MHLRILCNNLMDAGVIEYTRISGRSAANETSKEGGGDGSITAILEAANSGEEPVCINGLSIRKCLQRYL